MDFELKNFSVTFLLGRIIRCLFLVGGWDGQTPLVFFHQLVGPINHASRYLRRGARWDVLKGLDGHQAPSTSKWGGFYMTYIRRDFYGKKMGERQDT